LNGPATRHRDLQYLVSFDTQLLMYATPVIYPVLAIPEAYRPWMQANPLAPIVETFRYAYLGAGTVSLGSLLYSAAFMLAVLLIGLVPFNRIEQTFLDTV
jgi:lipopolysaccharide transport system permease protein